MITSLYRHAHIMWQENADGVSELAIGGSVDAGGIIVLSQEGRTIVVAPNAVNELCRMLRQLRAASEGGEK